MVKDTEGKEYLIFDSSELFNDNLIGNKFLDEGGFGKVFKVKSKLNQ